VAAGRCTAAPLVRRRPGDAPPLQRVPLVRWARGDRYAADRCHLSPAALNLTLRDRPEAVSGVLMRFGLAADSPEARAEPSAVLFDPEVSRRYVGSAQLERLGLMQRGTWG
jgi:hypothetical protein